MRSQQCGRDGVVKLSLCFLNTPGSVVGIATGYVLDGSGIESRWGRDFSHLSRPALGPTQPPVQWVPGSFPWVKSGRSMTLTPRPLLVPWSWKGRAIPILSLWAVRPVQSLSACKRAHFTFFYFLLNTTLWRRLTSAGVCCNSIKIGTGRKWLVRLKPPLLCQG
jgi:hypothetical protein